ncbi:MAG: MFS transporter [Clostridia bacterium]|nr:MFS transporter [Clostridia bacterium]
MQTKLTAKQQKLLMFLCWLVYTMAYLGRFSYNSNKSVIQEVFALTTADTGLVSSFFFFAYGAGQIINGIFCKFYPKRYVLAGSLILSSVINLAIAFGVPFVAYKWLWLLNGLAQSFLWTSLMLVLGENLDKENLSKAVFVMGTTVAVGTFLSYGSSAIFASTLNFKPVFIIAAGIMTVVAIVWFIFYDKCTLSKEALLQIKNERKLKEEQENQQRIAEGKKAKKKIDANIIIFFVIMCFFAVFCKMTMDGLQEWTPNVLAEVFGMKKNMSILFTLCLPLVGILSSTICIWSRRFIKNIAFLASIYFFITAALILLIIFTLDVSAVPVIIGMSFASMFTHCVNGLLTSIAPLYLRDKVNSGLSSGLFNCFCYVGSTISGYGLGSIALLGWDTMFWLLFGLSIAGMVIGLIYYFVRRLTGATRKDDI